MLGEIYLVGQAESCYTKQYEVFTMLEMCVSLRLTITTISQRVARFATLQGCKQTHGPHRHFCCNGVDITT